MGSEKFGGVECFVGLGLNMRQSGGDFDDRGSGGGDCGGGGGPIYFTGNKQVVCMGDVYDICGGAAAGGVVGSVPTSLHHNNFNNIDTIKSPFSGYAMRDPFTSVQLLELERQSIIYKYMMASVPIPLDLLPSSSSSSDHHHHHLGAGAAVPSSNASRLLDMGCTSLGSHPEPWRCRRTDGKKWRCSRDVAPDQKYCERHIHKNKPRSRKLVESHSSISPTSSVINKATRPPVHTTKPPQYFNPMDHNRYGATYSNVAAAAASFEQSRYSDWLAKGETNSVDGSNNQWQPLMHSAVRLKSDSTSFGYHQIDDHQSVNVKDQCNLFLGPNLGISETPRDFMNAWSMTERDDGCNIRSSVSSNGKIPLSSLTLSMPGDNGVGNDDEEEDEECTRMSNLKSSQSSLNWMNTGSWMGCGSSQPGGPLAEALCLGMSSSVKSAFNLDSPHAHGESSDAEGSNGFHLM